jgi:hypothetical protein
MPIPPENDSPPLPEDSLRHLPTVGVGDIPLCITGRVYRFGVSRGATVATARMAGGRGRCAASLWQVHGEPLGWWVRTEDDRLHEFGEETDAVRFFVNYLRRLADGAP